MNAIIDVVQPIKIKGIKSILFFNHSLVEGNFLAGDKDRKNLNANRNDIGVTVQ